MTASIQTLPMPPLALRQLVGATEDHFYDNPSGAPLLDLPAETYDSVLDFGCGCGRLARQLIQQKPRPRRYVGIDLTAAWSSGAATTWRPMPRGSSSTTRTCTTRGSTPGAGGRRFPSLAQPSVSLMLAWSVFTHVNEAAATYYLETARVLRPDGVPMSTWFLFDKADFPMMQEFQNALFINDIDPTNAVIFDKAWLRATTAKHGLFLQRIVAPEAKGYQWQIWIAPRRPDSVDAEFPPDVAPKAALPPPLLPSGAERLGLDGD